MRNEHWFIAMGSGIALIVTIEINLQPDDLIVISIGTKHRISNNSDEPLVFIED